MFCQEQAAQLRGDIDEIHATGAELVVVGNGTPQQAAWFAEDTGLPTPVFTDPTREIYRRLDARRSWWGILDPRTLRRAFEAVRHGFRQQGVKGDARQLGGLFVIGDGGRPLYESRSRFAGDLPPREAWLEVLRENVHSGRLLRPDEIEGNDG